MNEKLEAETLARLEHDSHLGGIRKASVKAAGMVIVDTTGHHATLGQVVGHYQVGFILDDAMPCMTAQIETKPGTKYRIDFISAVDIVSYIRIFQIFTRTFVLTVSMVELDSHAKARLHNAAEHEVRTKKHPFL